MAFGDVFTCFFPGTTIGEGFTANKRFVASEVFAVGEDTIVGAGFAASEGLAGGEDSFAGAGFAASKGFVSGDFAVGAARLDADALAPCTAGKTICGFVLPISVFPLNHKRFPAVADASSDICRNYELVGIGSIACAKSEVSFAIPSEGGCWIARA